MKLRRNTPLGATALKRITEELAMGDLFLGGKVTCPECEGEGELECLHADFYTCPTCKGRKTISLHNDQGHGRRDHGSKTENG